ncbi:hypothetical protein [Winogradskyella thalassocola]|uniref:Uncharacterized protein n=1 Tax=Winogradskyella thalassocola TaxID=262004 RepID=A0A1G8D3Y9_9FLAO|nr:hypothetical protein [Winogradskyella thalassocola]SDH52244.1 hypothetical protein SAMN04489796_103112 [Winogradskyella thalassocola]
MKKLVVLILATLLFNCQNKKKDKHTISGTNLELIGDTMFLKKFQHFDYLDKNYILDIAVVNDKGEFSFEVKDTYPKLVSITNHNKPPNTYQVFKDSPEIFYYSFCANFLAETPTLYLENNSNYIIKHWDSKLNDSSIVYNSKKLNQLRKYYRNVDYRKGYIDNNREFLDITKEEAWKNVSKIRDSFLKDFDLDQDVSENTYEHYLKTEITLGAVNDFLIWYFRKTDNTIDDDFYKTLMETYNSEHWHPNSVEYYKLTEHYINYKLNTKHNKIEKYYEPSIEKYEVAKAYARENIKKLYIQNIERLIHENNTTSNTDN